MPKKPALKKKSTSVDIAADPQSSGYAPKRKATSIGPTPKDEEEIAKISKTGVKWADMLERPELP